MVLLTTVNCSRFNRTKLEKTRFRFFLGFLTMHRFPIGFLAILGFPPAFCFVVCHIISKY